MKRRSFLSLLGLAPAAPLIAKEMTTRTDELDPAVRIRMERGLPVMSMADETLQQPVSYDPQSQDWDVCTVNWDVCLASASFTDVSPVEIDFGSPPDEEKR